MNDINTTIMTGRLVDEPDLRGNNNDILSFTIAVNRSVKDGDDWKDEAQYFDWVRFKTSEKFAAMLHKGMLVTCKGSASVRKAVSKLYKSKDGKEHEYNQIQFIIDGRDGLEFALPPKGERTEKPMPTHYSDGTPIDDPKGPEHFEDDGDDIPF